MTGAWSNSSSGVGSGIGGLVPGPWSSSSSGVGSGGSGSNMAGAGSSGGSGGSESNMAGAGSSGGSGGSGSNMAGAGSSGTGSRGRVNLSQANDPRVCVERVEQASGTIQRFIPDNPPNTREEFSRLLIIGSEATESWAFVKFLASVFECQIDFYDTNRFMLQKCWRVGHDWQSDSELLRGYFQTFPDNLYTRLKHELGYHLSYLAYPHAAEQEVLLGQWQPGISIFGHITSPAVRELYYHFRDHLPINHNSLVGIRVVGNRLCEAVSILKMRLNDYKTEYGNLVDYEWLASLRPNGIEGPFAEFREESALPNYNE
jgi:hypothetical protein